MDAQKQFKDGCRRIQDAEVPTERSIEGYLVRMHENFVNEYGCVQLLFCLNQIY